MFHPQATIIRQGVAVHQATIGFAPITILQILIIYLQQLTLIATYSTFVDCILSSADFGVSWVLPSGTMLTKAPCVLFLRSKECQLPYSSVTSRT